MPKREERTGRYQGLRGSIDPIALNGVVGIWSFALSVNSLDQQVDESVNKVKKQWAKIQKEAQAIKSDLIEKKDQLVTDIENKELALQNRIDEMAKQLQEKIDDLEQKTQALESKIKKIKQTSQEVKVLMKRKLEKKIAQIKQKISQMSAIKQKLLEYAINKALPSIEEKINQEKVNIINKKEAWVQQEIKTIQDAWARKKRILETALQVKEQKIASEIAKIEANVKETISQIEQQITQRIQNLPSSFAQLTPKERAVIREKLRQQTLKIRERINNIPTSRKAFLSYAEAQSINMSNISTFLRNHRIVIEKVKAFQESGQSGDLGSRRDNLSHKTGDESKVIKNHNNSSNSNIFLKVDKTINPSDSVKISVFGHSDTFSGGLFMLIMQALSVVMILRYAVQKYKKANTKKEKALAVALGFLGLALAATYIVLLVMNPYALVAVMALISATIVLVQIGMCIKRIVQAYQALKKKLISSKRFWATVAVNTLIIVLNVIALALLFYALPLFNFLTHLSSAHHNNWGWLAFLSKLTGATGDTPMPLQVLGLIGMGFSVIFMLCNLIKAVGACYKYVRSKFGSANDEKFDKGSEAEQLLRKGLQCVIARVESDNKNQDQNEHKRDVDEQVANVKLTLQLLSKAPKNEDENSSVDETDYNIDVMLEKLKSVDELPELEAFCYQKLSKWIEGEGGWKLKVRPESSENEDMDMNMNSRQQLCQNLIAVAKQVLIRQGLKIVKERIERAEKEKGKNRPEKIEEKSKGRSQLHLPFFRQSRELDSVPRLVTKNVYDMDKILKDLDSKTGELSGHDKGDYQAFSTWIKNTWGLEKSQDVNDNICQEICNDLITIAMQPNKNERVLREEDNNEDNNRNEDNDRKNDSLGLLSFQQHG